MGNEAIGSTLGLLPEFTLAAGESDQPQAERGDAPRAGGDSLGFASGAAWSEQDAAVMNGKGGGTVENTTVIA